MLGFLIFAIVFVGVAVFLVKRFRKDNPGGILGGERNVSPPDEK